MTVDQITVAFALAGACHLYKLCNDKVKTSSLCLFRRNGAVLCL